MPELSQWLRMRGLELEALVCLGFLGFPFGFARVSVRVWWWRIHGFFLEVLEFDDWESWVFEGASWVLRRWFLFLRADSAFSMSAWAADHFGCTAAATSGFVAPVTLALLCPQLSNQKRPPNHQKMKCPPCRLKLMCLRQR